MCFEAMYLTVNPLHSRLCMYLYSHLQCNSIRNHTLTGIWYSFA
uniref:Uncharacterized protein n=1 Tax=Setaria italica TaxID=4555 RepID=K3ZPE9_SETIT